MVPEGASDPCLDPETGLVTGEELDLFREPGNLPAREWI